MAVKNRYWNLLEFPPGGSTLQTTVSHRTLAVMAGESDLGCNYQRESYFPGHRHRTLRRALPLGADRKLVALLGFYVATVVSSKDP